MDTCISHSAAETEALGMEWGRRIERGWVIGLSGDLGTGKTVLVKGIARGLGVKERILSPSFALVHSYESGRLPFFHLDLYRLDSRAEIVGAGLEEYLFWPAGVTVVEWVERWWGQHKPVSAAGPFLPGHYRQVWIEQQNESDRRILYEDSRC